ncbi:biotin-dependent carboxyltransferase family protein [Litorivivens sp.]|uniref:5-oxoprolinase subunit C family protein n=1 Tax=Litorivivens sp. TaxID=2020868 RepID=UPI003569F73C
MTHGLLVLQATAGTTIQDLGRVGYRRYGVTRSGAMDPVALQVANCLVGNPFNTPCIEFSVGGADFRVTSESLRCAFHGGDFQFALNGMPAPMSTSLHLRKGDILSIGGARKRIRGYLAVEGGFVLEPVLGSCATHTRSALGGVDGAALEGGQELECVTKEAPKRTELSLPYSAFPKSRRLFRVILGPQADRFTDDGISTFLESAAFRIDKDSDSVGYRLTGHRIEYIGDGNIVSDPVVPGCIQVPASGHPLILMADCPTTGGYPKIATVISTDLSELAQLPPGAEVSFRAVSLDEAHTARRTQQQWLAELPKQLIALN